MYAWLKIFHLFFVISWFAGIFYLPRIYVNLAQTREAAAYQMLVDMSRRLFRFTTIIAVLAIASGLAIGAYGHFHQKWLIAKVGCVLLLVAYHISLWFFYRNFKNRNNKRSHVFFRWFNEIPVLILLAILILVVFKPF